MGQVPEEGAVGELRTPDRNHRSMIEFWRGARTPVRITSMPAVANTASNAAPKDASLSWSRNFTHNPASCRSHRRDGSRRAPFYPPDIAHYNAGRSHRGEGLSMRARMTTRT
jgi:hypothetical protein